MKNRIPFILLIIISVTFMFSFYGKMIFHPDQYLFNDEGDAIKNYYTYCYHIKYDSACVDFRGMNYPYGENFLYTDCHPILTGLFQLPGPGTAFFADHSIAILNLIMTLSIFLTFFVCYFLLRKFNINRWFSLLFCIGITLLAPQIFRLEGHLALSYSLAIPLSWLLILQCFSSRRKWLYSILLFFNNLLWLFIHAYLGMIVLFFLVVLLVTKYISDKNRREELVQTLRIAVAIILPILLFWLFALLSDTHTGRTDNPSGFFSYTAEPDDVFLPHHPPLRPLLDQLTGNAISQQWEAWSYVGLSTGLIFLILLVLAVLKLFNRKKVTALHIYFRSPMMNLSLLSAFIVLLFAMAIPFRQIPGLVDLFPVIKQFRATGRFTWPFYFAAMVFAATVMQETYSASSGQRRKFIILVLCVFAGIFNIAEGLPYHSEISNMMGKTQNLFKKEFLPDAYQAAIQRIRPESFQAIIALPFYYQGSESFSRPRQEETVRASLCVAYQTGIPLVCANLTRTSIWESKNIVQIVSPGFYKKEILKDLPGDKPFLIIRTKDPITRYEKDILEKCSPIFLSEAISLYSLKKDDLFKNNANDIYNQYKQLQPGLFKRGPFYLSDDTSFFYYNDFEAVKSAKPFRGKGGFHSMKQGKNTFAEFAPNTFKAGKKYHVSLWMYNGLKDALNFWLRFMIEEYNAETNTWVTTTWLPEQSEVIYGNWSLVEGTFEMKNPKNKIFIVTKGKDISKQALFADDLLITEEGLDVYRLSENGEKLFFNNHEIVLH